MKYNKYLDKEIDLINKKYTIIYYYFITYVLQEHVHT